MSDRDDALRLLTGLENGALSPTAGAPIAGRLDPVLLWAVVRFLRDVYPASDPAATPVLQRVVDLTSSTRGFVERMKEGEADPLAGWFLSEYAFREWKGRGPEMIELIVEKIES